VYNPSASSTAKDLKKTFSITYGSGATVSGEQYSDDVSIAGLTVRGAFFFSIRKKGSHFTIGDGPDAWRRKSVFCGFPDRKLSARRPDGHGFQIHIGL
jgi:hypothetical protein